MLTLDPFDMVCYAINLIVLYLLMRKFLFGPVTSMIERRKKEIEHNIASAEGQRAQAEALLEEYNGKLSTADQDANALIASAKTKAESAYAKTMALARQEAEHLASETREQLEVERREMLVGVRREVASLALLAAARVSGRGFGAEDDAALLDEFLDEAGDPL